MGKIKQMSEMLANQIAAGEVVERPASVVKELVENAIDAGSRDITVEIVESGIQRIRVIDNGEGMDEEDLRLAFLPHATSKIYDLNDLHKIHSLGFRGEALASIGSVAKVRVESAQEESNGHFIEIEASRIVNSGVHSARKGTTMTVDSLFYNTPARLKHLTSLKTELRHILNFMQDIALSYPHIRFTLISDGNKVFTSYGNGDLKQTIANVYQANIARQLVPIEASDYDFKISGFISPPQLTRNSKYYLHWMINGRVIRSYVLNDILIKAYGKQLMIGRYPLAVVRIELDPRLVDVNVHPTKQTVRLSKEAELSQLLTQAIQEALGQLNPIPELAVEDVRPIQPVGTQVEQAVSPPISPKVIAEQLPLEFQTDCVTPSKLSRSGESTSSKETEVISPADSVVIPTTSYSLDTSYVAESVGNFDTVNETPTHIEEVQEPAVIAESSSVERDSRSGIDFGQLRYVGQIHGTYLIAESEQGFYLIDQHAAQERLRYEQFMNDDPDVFQQQYLLLPVVLQFTLAEMMSVEAVLPLLVNLGIHLELFGPTSYQMESYPLWLGDTDLERSVHDLVAWLLEHPNLTVTQIKEQSIIMQSCRGAIKANHYLDDKQAIALIRQMATLQDPYHCPHGRPVFVEFNTKTLEKLFKRIQDPHERKR